MERRPNILFIMSDDHAARAISAYGSVINATPHIDRIADEGVRLDACFCTNSICAPSRGTILTGTYSHVNGVRTLADSFDGRQESIQQLLGATGYQTAMVGKWHLGHGGEADPKHFDFWHILYDQGPYFDPTFATPDGDVSILGYTTTIITDLALEWLEHRDEERPFLMFLHHKAPHRPWEPDETYASMYDDIDIPVPTTFDDDLAGRSHAAQRADMRMEHLTETDTKGPVPDGLSVNEERHWRYQRFIKDYLRCVASVDDAIGRVLAWLDKAGIADDTIVIYTSDQGFFLGDHGWFDKRFMYEESLKMPFVMRYPREIPASSSCDAMITNVDFAPTFMDYAGLEPTDRMQGRSFRSIVGSREVPADWRDGMYYRYWMHNDPDHRVAAHYGIRTHRYKLIYYYGDPLDCTQSFLPRTEPEWELFDLENDPLEMRNVYHDGEYGDVRQELQEELLRLQAEAGDVAYVADGASSSEPGT